MISKNKKFILAGITIFIIVILLFFLFSGNKNKNFSTDTFLLKSVIKQGEKSTANFLITSNEKNNFEVSIFGLDGLVSSSESIFSLNKNENKNLIITFEDVFLKYIPGVYVGKLFIKTDSYNEEIPIILEIQSQSTSFSINLDVPEKSKDIIPGEESLIYIKFYNWKDSLIHNLNITYSIKNIQGETFFSETGSVAVGSQSVLTKTIIFPENIPFGKYVFSVKAQENNSYVSTSSYIFRVNKNAFVSETFNNFSFQQNFILIIILFFLFIIITLIIYLIYERDKLFFQLRKQQYNEIRNYRKKIDEEKKKCISRAKPKEKKKILKRFVIVKKVVIRKIKEKHKKQRQILKHLKKRKKKSEMQRKLSEWKKRGVNINEFKHLLYSKQANLKNLKKKGFDTSAID